MTKQLHTQTPWDHALPIHNISTKATRHRENHSWITAAAISAGVLVGFVLVAYLILPAELPAWIQRMLALVNATLAVIVFVLATHRSHHHPDLAEIAMRRTRSPHPDFGKQLRDGPKHDHPRTIALPIVGETSVRAVGGTGVFFGVLFWWLTPWAPVLVLAQEWENLSISLGREIESVVLTLADTQLAVPYRPVCPAVAAALAARISVDDGPYMMGQKATAEGRYDDARSLLNAALTRVDADVPQIKLALAQNDLFAGRSPEAASQYDVVLQAYPLEPRLWSEAAVAWLHAGNHQRAEELAKAAVTLCEQRTDLDDSRVPDVRVTCLHVLAAVFVCRGREFDKAGQYNKQAQDVWRDSSQRSTTYAASVNNQAVLFQLLGKYPGAQNNQNLANTTWMEELGERHPYAVVGRGNLAMLYYVQGRYGDAQRVAEQLVRIRREILPPTDPAQAMALNLSALVDLAAGSYRSGLSKASRALEILEENLSPQHPQVAAVSRVIGGLYQALARYRRAEYYFYRMAEISQGVLGDSHPYFASSRNLLGSLYLADGRYDEARRQAEFALSCDEKVLRDDHPSVARDLCLLAQVRSLTNRVKESQPLLERALKIQQAALPDQHPDIAWTQTELAALENTPATYAEGIRLYQEALQTEQVLLGERHPMVAQIYYGLGKLDLGQGKYTVAEEQIKRCLEIRKGALVPYHPQLAETLELWADVLRKSKPDDKEAIKDLMKQAAQIRSDHADINAENNQSAGNAGG